MWSGGKIFRDVHKSLSVLLLSVMYFNGNLLNTVLLFSVDLCIYTLLVLNLAYIAVICKIYCPQIYFTFLTNGFKSWRQVIIGLLSSFIAVMEQMGGQSICQLWHHPACAQTWRTSAVSAVDGYGTLLKGRELFCLHLIFKLKMSDVSCQVVAIVLSWHICMQFILDKIWFLNAWWMP